MEICSCGGKLTQGTWFVDKGAKMITKHECQGCGRYERKEQIRGKKK